ncbi:hypothetical protein OK074_4038 [Actinobacteria bacterium OK074]|nr:hypothetical protein OK074_4038 [Actinobacteria bacterium OK074]
MAVVLRLPRTGERGHTVMSHRRRAKRLESAAFTTALMAAWAVAVLSAVTTLTHHP